MTTLFDIEGAVGVIVMAAPFVVMLVLLARIVVTREMPVVSKDAGAAAPPPSEPAASPGVAFSDAGPVILPRPGTGLGGAPNPPPDDGLERALAAAEDRFDDAAVARLSLELGQRASTGGLGAPAAASHLRRAVIIATRLGDSVTHASARLELGDLAASDGDMTTACEHWQLARQIYWDGDDAAGLAEADRRMRDNGCPTDWVLNDF